MECAHGAPKLAGMSELKRVLLGAIYSNAPNAESERFHA
jgi:hypothetical protein